MTNIALKTDMCARAHMCATTQSLVESIAGQVDYKRIALLRKSKRVRITGKRGTRLAAESVAHGRRMRLYDMAKKTIEHGSLSVEFELTRYAKFATGVG